MAIDETRIGETGYIAWPDHPDYGRAVQIFRQVQVDNQAWCLIEDLSHPGFHVQMKAQWLSSTRPGEPHPQAKTAPIILSLSALDKLVQMILSKNQLWRVDKDDEPSTPSQSPPVAAPARRKQKTAQSQSVLHSPQAEGRDEG